MPTNSQISLKAKVINKSQTIGEASASRKQQQKLQASSLQKINVKTKKIRIIYQFSHVRCQEALHSLRSALMIQRHHSLKSYALFVNLVKAFNSFQHDVLYAILKKYGLPLSLINVINKMYQNCHVHLKIGKNM